MRENSNILDIMSVQELSEQEIVRRGNLQQMRDLGIDPYPAAEYPTDAFSTDIKAEFVDLPTMTNEQGEYLHLLLQRIVVWYVWLVV